jgi:hypothetical protein
MSKYLERRLLNVEEAYRRSSLAGILPLYVRYVGDEDLRPYGATEVEQARYTAIIDQINAYAQDLVHQHGPGIHRDHKRNDAYAVLACDEVEFVEHMIATYRPSSDDQEAA